MSEPSNVVVRQHIYNEITIRIARDITAASDFTEELNAIHYAGAQDVVVLDLTTDGGMLDTAKLFQRAIAKTHAFVKCIIGPSCHSAGGMIALACDEWEVDEDSTIMVHAASFGFRGKHNEVASRVEHELKWLRRMFENVYTGFLTQEEINDCLNGQDFWISGDDLVRRLESYQAYRDAKREAEEAEEELDMPVSGA